MVKKEKIPAPGAKADTYTNFQTKAKWKTMLLKSIVELSGRNIRPGGALSVSNAVVKSKNITSVDLSGNHLSDDGAIEFAQCLKTNENIRMINLSNNEISDIGGIALAAAFIPNANPNGLPGQWNRNVQDLNLSGNAMKDDTLFAFCNAAACHLNLYQVDLQYNKIGPVGAKGFWRMMQRNTLCQFILHHNLIGDEGTQRICEAWKRFGKVTTNVQKDPKDPTKEITSKSSSQELLNLTCNDICAAGAEAVGDLVANNDFLENCSLAWNTLGPKGMTLFVAKLTPPMGAPPIKIVLKELNVSYCCLAEGGSHSSGGKGDATALGSLIELNLESLQILNASKNEYGPAGGVTLGNALLKNSHLVTVNFSDNHFKDDKVVDSFCSALKDNKSIAKFLLKKCEFEDHQKDRLRNASSRDIRPVDTGAGEEVMLTEFFDKVTAFMANAEEEEAKNAAKKKPKKAKAKK